MAASQLDYQEIRYRLQNHAVFRLLRKERVAFILAFLISAFKTRQRSDIPESELVTELTSYIDMVRLTSLLRGETPSSSDEDFSRLAVG
jgi:hypothetical protein